MALQVEWSESETIKLIGERTVLRPSSKVVNEISKSSRRSRGN